MVKLKVVSSVPPKVQNLQRLVQQTCSHIFFDSDVQILLTFSELSKLHLVFGNTN